jgi:hypothetical protein
MHQRMTAAVPHATPETIPPSSDAWADASARTAPGSRSASRARAKVSGYQFSAAADPGENRTQSSRCQQYTPSTSRKYPKTNPAQNARAGGRLAPASHSPPTKTAKATPTSSNVSHE